MRAAAVHMVCNEDTASNVDQAADLIRRAAREGATYVQTPEMTTLLTQTPSVLFQETARAKTDAACLRFAALAKELSITLHIGSMAVAHDESTLAGLKIANRAHVFGPDGALLAQYDKIHMFDVDLDHGESWRESAIYKAGQKAVLANLPEGAKLGLGICYDVRFAALFRAYAQAGAHILSAPAAFTRQTGAAHWHVLQRARAIECGAFMVSAAQGGDHADGRDTFGHAIIVDPWGHVLAETGAQGPDLAVADLDMAAVTVARRKIPALTHDRTIGLACAVQGSDAA